MLENRSRFVRILAIVILFILLIFSIIMAVNLGAVDMSASSVFRIIWGKMTESDLSGQFDKNEISIIWSLRFPKVLVAGCTGAGLGLAGIMMQALTKNSLADPYVLGISSGASTGAVLSLLVGTIPIIGKVPLAEGAFFGALLAAVLVFVISGAGYKTNTTKLLLVGMALSALFSALTNFVIFLTPDSHQVQSAMFWMTGSFAGTSWSDVPLAASVLGVGLIFVCLMQKEMDALLMGEDIARNVGVNTKRVKILLILVSTILTSALVSMSGIIGFAGLVIPHVARTFAGTSHHKMIPITVLLGAVFMIWADVIARTLASPKELPVGVVTALFGAPFFLAMLKRSHYEFGK